MIKNIFTVHIVVFLQLFILTSFAQTVTNDLTFNPTDVGFEQGDGPASQVNAVAIQSDGKSIIGGSFTSYNWKSQPYIMRLDINGDIDPSFNIGTGFNNIVNAIAIQPDGKIIVAGGFFGYNGQSIKGIARLNADGSLDNTFNPGTGPNSNIRTMALQSDGKIIIGGDFIAYKGTSRNHIARLNSDGSLDASFSVGTGTNSQINSVAVQSDNKVLIGGKFTTYNGSSANGIARLNTDGSFDTAFLTGTGISAFTEVKTIAIQADAQILIGGTFTKYNDVAVAGICRLMSDGTLDGTFTASASTVNTINIQADNRIIIGGPFSTVNSTEIYAVARLETNGALDTGFNPIVTGAASTVYALGIQSDGKMIIGGALPYTNGIGKYRMFRLNNDSSLDTSFNHNTGANDVIYTTAVQADDKILIGGVFTLYNGTERNHIARLNADGTLDLSFNPGTGTNGIINSIVVQPDGKILVGGSFNYFNGTQRSCIVRLNSDGSLDPTFNPGSGINGAYVRTILLQSDGRIILGGNFLQYNNAGYNGIVRITSTGGYDVSFSSGLSVTNSVESMVQQPDGKIVIGGTFTSYGGTARNNIARINSNGTLDTSFDPGQGTDQYVSSLVLQPDQKIIIGGFFTSYNSSPKNHLLRVNADGSVDATFDSGAPSSTLNIYSMQLQTDGKLLLTGYFPSYNNTNVGSFLRLNSDGTIDANYVATPGADGWTYALGFQSDGKIILAGGFMSFNSTGRNRITRLLSSPCTPPTITSTTPAESCVSGSVTLAASASSGTLNWYTSSIGGIPLSSGTSYTTPVLTYTTIYYVEANIPNCPSGREAITASINIPMVSVTTPASRCGAGTVLLNASGNTGSTLDWYDLSEGGSSLGTGTTFTTPVLSSPTTYYVESSIGGCVTASRTAVIATVKGLPDKTTTVTGSTITSSESGAGYAWLDCNNGSSIIVGQSTKSYTPAQNGDYAVVITKNGCTDTSNCVNISITGIVNSNRSTDFILSPNPATGVFTIESAKTINSLTVTNGTGEVILQQNVDSTTGKVTLEEVKNGIYYLHVTTSEGVQTLKLVVNK